MQKNIFIILASIALFLLGMNIGFAQGLSLPSGAEEIIKWSSISIHGSNVGDKHDVNQIRGFGFSLLILAKLIVSGFALIYIVLVGAYMVIYSDDEATITKQKQQLLYVLIGFLFLNLPTIIYDVFINPSHPELSDPSWTSTDGTAFWNITYLNTFSDALMWFFRVLVYIVAVGMFTWSAFILIASRGKEEYRKTALNRFLYGSAALFFLGIAEVWLGIVKNQNLSPSTLFDSQLAQEVFNFLFFLAGPVAIFFLMIGAYYYITSAGDEERTKKGKNIVINTAIATIILLASFSFIDEVIKFLK